jgi:alginate O-acetyltransferase complex protein AlgI
MTIYTSSILAVILLMWVAAWNLRSVKARQALLLLASYVFYSGWGTGFLSILIISSLLNFTIGWVLRRRLSIGYLWLGIALNVGLLGFFKYLPPVLAIGGAEWQAELARRIIMPVGISFWTFQGLSYLIDIYLEEEVDPSLLEFCLYMAFWPTVLSGPVCRLPKMLPQFRREPVFSWDNISAGALCLMQGFFMKMYLAPLLAAGWRPGAGVAAGFDQMTSGWGGVDVWLLGMGFGFQLFFDFAGYSLMVIGVARLFGIQIPQNFARPFLSTTPAIFWTRWHMSLSFWIRDYVFKPLAFARRDRWWPYVALVISMTLFGLWHGAKWTFIVFGVYHGLLLAMHRLGQLTKPRLSIRLPRSLGVCLAWGATFLLVSLGYILFRANDLSQALLMLGSVFSAGAYRHFAMPRDFYILTFTIVCGYFAFTVGHSLLLSWRERYRMAMSQSRPTVEGSWQLNLSNVPLIAGALFDFLAARLWWWLAPAVVSLTVFVGLAIYTQSLAIPVTPFIYTLF